MTLQNFILVVLLLSCSLNIFSQNGDIGIKKNILGDVNNNGEVDIEDITSVLNYLNGNTSVAFNKDVADIDGNGEVDLGDIDGIVDIICNPQRNTDNYTLFLTYKLNRVVVVNPDTAIYRVTVNKNNADVMVSISDKREFPEILVTGTSNDGRLSIASDVDYILTLNGINLTSSHAPAINSMSKQKVTIVLSDGTENTFSDSKNYSFSDSIETASGCFNALGAMKFNGNGRLTVTGNSKHAIYSKKSITFTSGTYNVANSISDAIHSGKNVIIDNGDFYLSGMGGEGFDMDEEFCMNGGIINMDITGEAAKGIKSGSIMTLNGGSITATASGTLKNKNGNLSYCTILKSDSDIVINGGDYHLQNSSPGGKCISADKKLIIYGGTIYTETNGDGAEYTNADGVSDYYTSKCIAVDERLYLYKGNIHCLSTGLGGKGIVASDNIYSGNKSYDVGDSLKVYVETQGWSVVDDITDDEREGCPKAVKSGMSIYMYGGYYELHTKGMGGEGIEASGMKMYNGNLYCETYDDGINLQQDLTMRGGQIYCCSSNNDGIDSNGGIKIYGGNVLSVSQHFSDESFDTENSDLHINGGIVIGLSPSFVDIGTSDQPVYLDHVETFAVKEGAKYIVIDSSGNILTTFISPVTMDNCRIIISLPQFEDGALYKIILEDAQEVKEISPILYNN